MQNFDLDRIVEAAVNGDESAFRKLYDISGPKAYYTALCVTRKENDAVGILQNSYSIMCDRLPRLKYPQMFENWFYRIVCKCIFDFIVKQNPASFDSFNLLDPDSFDDELDGVYVPDPDYAQNDRVVVTKILDHLPVDRKLVFLMYYYFGMNITEISTVLGVDEKIAARFLDESKKIVKVNVKDSLVSQNRVINCSPIVFYATVLRNCSSHVPFKASDMIFNNIFNSHPVRQQPAQTRTAAVRNVTVSESDSTQMYSGEEAEAMLRQTRSSFSELYGRETSKGGGKDDEIPAAESTAKVVKIAIIILVIVIFAVAAIALLKNIAANKGTSTTAATSETTTESAEEETVEYSTAATQPATTLPPETTAAPTTQEPSTQQTETQTAAEDNSGEADDGEGDSSGTSQVVELFEKFFERNEQ